MCPLRFRAAAGRGDVSAGEVWTQRRSMGNRRKFSLFVFHRRSDDSRITAAPWVKLDIVPYLDWLGFYGQSIE